MVFYDGNLYDNEMNDSDVPCYAARYDIQQIDPELPTGNPTGPTPIGSPRRQMRPTPIGTPTTPQVPLDEQIPVTLESTLYLPGYLKTQIGKRVRVEFLIGSNGPMVDRIGTLLAVGASYIILRPVDTDDTLTCDLYSIKFVTIYH